MKYTKHELLDLTQSEDPINFDNLYLDLNSSDEEIRECIAELLSYDNSTKSKEVLLNYLKNDNSELVRSEAANSLSAYKDKDLIDKLLDLFCKEHSEVVQNYIIYTIIDINKNFKSKNTINALLKIFGEHNNNTVKIIIYGYLYNEKVKNDLNYLFDYLSNENYYLRIFSIREIANVCNAHNINDIQNRLQSYDLSKEECITVVEYINGILAYEF